MSTLVDNPIHFLLNITIIWGLIQYIPRNMHMVFALLCFVMVIHWLIFPYPSGLLHWHCGNLTIAPVPAKQPWWIWINTSCEFIMNDCITTTKQSTTKQCAYFLGYTVWQRQVSGARMINYIPHIQLDIITYPCPIYLHLAHKSWHQSVNLLGLYFLWVNPPISLQLGRHM